jgi:hypothetical protein
MTAGYRMRTLLRVSALPICIRFGGACGRDATGTDETGYPSLPNAVSVYFECSGCTLRANLGQFVWGQRGEIDTPLTLPVGTNEIVGTFTGTQLRISFGGAGLGSGGVKLNSPISVSGPVATTDKCGVTYTRNDYGTSDFRMQFIVDPNVNNHHC